MVSDGEQAFVELLNSIDNGKSGVGIPGVGSFENGKFVSPHKDISTLALAGQTWANG